MSPYRGQKRVDFPAQRITPGFRRCQIGETVGNGGIGDVSLLVPDDLDAIHLVDAARIHIDDVRVPGIRDDAAAGDYDVACTVINLDSAARYSHAPLGAERRGEQRCTRATKTTRTD